MSWNERTLFELTGKEKGAIQTGPFGSQLHSSDYVDQGTPVVMPQDIIDDRISTEKIACVADPMVRKLSKHALEVGDIVYPRRGDLDKRAFVTSEQEGWLCGTGCIRLRLPNEHLSPQFLFYYLKQPHVVKFIENKAIGATMLNLNTSILESVPVRYPYAKVQTRIADILSAYDDLIENNNRRMALLEEAIHLLYREWFVYLRFPGHERVEVVDGVPEEWERSVASDLIGFNPRTLVTKDEVHSYVPMGSLSTSSMCLTDMEKRIPKGGAKFKSEDTLLARITPCLENGKTGYVQFLSTDEEIATGSTEFIVMRGVKVPPTWVYCLARSATFRQHAINSMTGSDGRQRVGRDSLEGFKLLLPPKQVLEEWKLVARPHFDQVHVLSTQNQRLREARDLLLPRLMNGSIVV